LGPGPLEPQVEHAEGFAATWELERGRPPTIFLDLGSGGGLPGLLLLERWSSPGVLMDAMAKRTAFLAEVLAWQGAPTSGVVVTARAEEMARTPIHESRYELVTARSFGRPAVVAECAARLIAPGGLLIVSEPPDGEDSERRWPAGPLDELGLSVRDLHRGRFGFQVLVKTGDTPPAFPRRNGMPNKRPLF
jgi:16S rRNA (guanine527-N7)-methyltransferase